MMSRHGIPRPDRHATAFICCLIAGMLACLAIAPPLLAGANTPPHLDRNFPLVVAEGGSELLNTALLLTTDAESPNTQITYTINPDGFGSAPTEGVLMLSGNPIGSGDSFTQDDLDNDRLTYVHDGGETTADAFQFGVVDGDGAPASDGGFEVFTFNIVVTPVNDAPATVDAAYSIPLGNDFHGTLQAVDPDSPILTFSIETNGSKGTAALDDVNLGTFTYTPLPGESGTDEFTFKVFDGLDYSVQDGKVTLHMENQPPVATPDSVTTVEEVAYLGSLAATDPDLPAQALTYALDTDGSKGHVVVTNPATGAFTYTPNPAAIGSDSFTFRANDGSLDSDPVTVKVGILPRLDPGDLLVSDSRAHAVFIVDTATGQIAPVSYGGLLGNARGVAIDADGKVDCISPGFALARLDPLTGGQVMVAPGATFTTSPIGPIGVAVESSGQILVADGTHGLLRVDPITGIPSTLALGGSINLAIGVTVAPNGDIYVTDGSLLMGGASKVVKVDPVSGTQTVVTSGDQLTVPSDVAIEAGGTLLVTDATKFIGAPASRLVRVDPGTGVQTLLSSGGLLGTPTGITLIGGGDIVVADTEGGNLVRVDPVTGDKSVLFTDAALQKPLSIRLVGLELLDAPDARIAVSGLQLAPCRPNPARGTVRIDYALPRSSRVRLALFDISGRQVARLVDGDQPAGRHGATFESRDLPVGVYLVRLEAGRERRASKLVIAR